METKYIAALLKEALEIAREREKLKQKEFEESTKKRDPRKLVA